MKTNVFSYNSSSIGSVLYQGASGEVAMSPRMYFSALTLSGVVDGNYQLVIDGNGLSFNAATSVIDNVTGETVAIRVDGGGAGAATVNLYNLINKATLLDNAGNPLPVKFSVVQAVGNVFLGWQKNEVNRFSNQSLQLKWDNTAGFDDVDLLSTLFEDMSGIVDIQTFGSGKINAVFLPVYAQGVYFTETNAKKIGAIHLASLQNC